MPAKTVAIVNGTRRTETYDNQSTKNENIYTIIETTIDKNKDNEKQNEIIWFNSFLSFFC